MADAVPDFIWDLFPLVDEVGSLEAIADYADTLTDFASDPAGFIRKFVVGWLIAGVAWIVRPFFDAIQVVFLGSQPGTFAGPGETWGLVDLPVALAGVFGDTVGSVIRSFFDAISWLILSAIPPIPGPIDGLVLTAVFIVLAVVTVRVGVPLLRAGLEAVPVVGGPLSTLLGEL